MRPTHVLALLLVAAAAVTVVVLVLSDSEPAGAPQVFERAFPIARPDSPEREDLSAPLVEPDAGVPDEAVDEREVRAERREVKRTGLLAGRAPAELRWVEGTLLLPPGAQWDETVRALSVAPPERERARAAIFGRMAGERDRPAQETEVLYETSIEPDGSFRVACAAGAEWAYLEVDARFLYLPEPQALKLEGEVTLVEIAPMLGASIRGTWVAPAGALERELSLGGGSAHLTVPSGNPFAAAFLGGADDAGPGVFHRVRAAADGTFEMRGVDPYAGWVLVSTPPLLASRVTEDLELVPGEVLELEIPLTRGATVAGRVVERNGGAVAGARIEVKVGDEETDFGETRLLDKRITTKSDGTFALYGIPPGEIRLQAEKDGYRKGIRKKLELAEGESETDIELKLRRGNALRGLVKWADGTPAPGAVLQVGRDATGRNEPLEASARTLHGEYEADDRGRFEISGLKRRAQSVWAFAVRRIGGRLVEGVAQKDGVKPNERDEHVLVLEDRPLLTGRVLDFTGEPVSRFTVLVRADEGAGSMMRAMMSTQQAIEREVESEDGVFQLDRIGDGPFSVVIEAEGFATSTPIGVELPPLPDAVPLEIVLQPFAGISGLVVSAAGDPVPGARVVAAPRALETIDRMLTETVSPDEVLANARGEFSFTQLDPGELALQASAANGVPSARMNVDLVGGEARAGIVLSLREGARLTGELLDVNGAPLEDRTINVTSSGPGTEPFGLRGWVDTRSSTTTDTKGWFELEGLVPGRAMVALEPSAEEFAAARGEDGGDWRALMEGTARMEVELFDRETTHVVLGGALETGGDPILVRGRVTRLGVPLTGSVEFSLDAPRVGLPSRQVQLEEEGRFTIELGTTGEYRIRVNGDVEGTVESYSHTFERIVSDVGDQELVLALPAGRIAGRVFDPDGEPAGEVQMTLRRLGPSSADRSNMGAMFGGEQTNEDGTYEFEDLEPGTYVIGAGSPMIAMFVGGAAGYGRTNSPPVTLETDENRGDVDIVLGKPGELVGRVLGEDGEPVNGASIYLFNEGGIPVDVVSTVTSNASGKFTYEGLTEGTYSALARTEQLASLGSELFRVKAEGSTEVELEALPGTKLQVSLFDGAGNLLRPEVSVTDGDGRELSGLFGFSGIFASFQSGAGDARRQEVGPIAAGRYRVVARSSDGREAVRDVVVGYRDDELEVELRLDD